MQKILIIDDEPHILLMLKKMLERAGFEIDMASNGNEGLELFRKSPTDMVITDIIMPEKEGLETIREMKRMRPELKIIAMSGGGKVSAENYLEIAKIFGASRVISKPFTQKDMVSAVQGLMGPDKRNDQPLQENKNKDENRLEQERN